MTITSMIFFFIGALVLWGGLAITLMMLIKGNGK
ncbi:MAG: MetS family NSS transporter small subunit [Sarcina sp.]